MGNLNQRTVLIDPVNLGDDSLNWLVLSLLDAEFTPEEGCLKDDDFHIIISMSINYCGPFWVDYIHR